MDLNYQWVSGNTYQITLVAYGNCAGTAFASLATATPQICIYDSSASIASITLAIDAAESGIFVSPVCPADTTATTCTSLTSTIPGIKKYTYTGTYTFPGTSHKWRILFGGNMGTGVSAAGRSASITNINNPGASITALVDTLDNSYGNNSSPVLTVGPTPYYCLNDVDSYNPGASYAAGDSVYFYLVPGLNNTATTCAGASTAAAVTYNAGFSATNPLAVAAGTFSFNPLNGQIDFNPNAIQDGLVVYNVREYRHDTLLGTSQREMTFLVQTCTQSPPYGGIVSATGAGAIQDSVAYQICTNSGAFTLQMDPVEASGTASITVTYSGLPAGSTVTVTNNSTPNPIATFSWTSTGVTPGTYTFYLTYTDNNCPIAGTATYAFNVTINTLGAITAAPGICVGSTTTLTDATAGGTWSTTSGNVTVGSSSGVVTGVASGTATVSYAVGTCFVSTIVTVNLSPTAILGSRTACIGVPNTLSDGVAGGTWTSSTIAIATIGSSTGTVMGVASGQTIITYTLTDGCSDTTLETIEPTPSAILGTLTVCVGTSSTLSDAGGAGTWSVSNANANIGSSSGTVIGVTAGTTIVSYFASTGCYTTAILTINAQPAAITPVPATVCLGGTLALTDATGGGTWSSSNAAVGTIGTSGVLAGLGVGTTTIVYAIAGCSANTVATVNTAPVAITPATATVCTGSTITLTDATSGGVWASSNGNATVVAGTVSGVTAGTATISYSVGTCSSTAIVTINATPVAITPVPVTICSGGTDALTDATTGGTWSSSTIAVATVGTGGLVTAVGIGTTTISYTLAGCSATTVATVNNGPVAITPATATVCTGSTTTLTDATTGGVWTSSNGNATVVGGTVTGVTAGTSTISYSIGTCSSTAIVTINATPAAISPVPVTICSGGTDALTDATSGGTWSSSTIAVATVGTGGLVTAVGIGTTTISYTLAGCSAITVATVNNAPAAITPATASVCTGLTTTFTDATAGGVWSSSNGNATVVGGTVTGVTAGTSTISYAIGTCSTTAIVTVNASPAAITPVPVTICLGGTDGLTDATSGGVWSSSTIAVGTVAGGLVTAVGVGTTTISYTVGSCSAITVATVNNAPGAITPATGAVCTGSTITLTDATSGGVWNASNGNATVAAGIVTGVTPGTVTISYAIGTCYSTAVVTVNAGVAAISPSSASLCIGNTATLTDVTGGGIWSASNGNATVAGGLVTAISTGIDTVYYTLGSCRSSSIITISSTPSAITPATASVCIGSTANFTDAVSGGVWSTSNGNATVGVTGIVTGVTAGTSTISYAIGSCIATASVTVNPGATAGTITGPTVIICVGASIDLTDAITGGTWSESTGFTTVGSSSGVVTGIAVGTDIITYTVNSLCGIATSTYTVNVVSSLGSGTILGPLTICQGSYDIYLDYDSLGTWSVSNGNAVISPVGVVTAINAGPETIIYLAPGACVPATLSVNIIPSSTGAGTITGPGSVCLGSSITLSDATAPGGTWMGTNAHASVGTGNGQVTGVSAGLDTVIYTVITACGTYTTSATVNVDASSTPTAISGPSTVCVGSSTQLSDADAGGVWSSSNADATVTTGGGLVTGVLPGLDTITYTVINGCGLGSITKVMTVMPTPTTGTITGPSAVCIGGTITLTDATVAGGTWSAVNGNATVSSTGIVTGVTSGTDDILYTITASCGTASAVKTITINALPDAGTVLGPDSVCVGSTITLNDFTTGGVWSAGNGNASISGVSYPSAVITGVSVGTDPISYTLSSSCGSVSAVKIVTVIDVPNPGVITGISTVCVGSAITLIDTVPGGIWLSSNGNAELIGPGIVSGVTAGIDSIFYVLTNACGTNEARHIVTVNPIPSVPAISGPTSQCVGTINDYTDGLAGGIWTVTNVSLATINSSTGSVLGLAQGIDTVNYIVTNAFGCPGMASIVDTINAQPVVGAIMGNTSVCLTSTISLSDTTAGGVWSSSNTSVATVDVSGNVTGTGAGVVTISYSVTGICGVTSSTLSVTVNPLPVISAILGTTGECVGATVTLSDVTAGGVWSSSNTAVATVDGSGDVTGITPGTTTIFYMVTNTFGCTSSVSVTVSVNALPVVAAITGTTNECIGSVSTLNDATGGGVWSSSNTAIATVDGSGDVTGVTGGIATISYMVTNASGCSSFVTTPDTVNTMPVSSPINGTMSVCVGSTTSLSDAVSGGIWTSTNTSVATVDVLFGTVTGIAAGSATVIYTVTNSCGSAADSALITVNGLPVVSPITATTTAICSGSTVTLNDATGGGVWSSSNTTVATVNSTGAVTGIANGTATITYMVTNASGCSSYVTYNITIATAIAGVDVVPASATLCHGSLVNMHISSTVPGLTYQWFCNGNIIAGATNSGYITDSAGNYTLEVSNGTCTETLTGTVVSNQPHPVVGFNAPNMLFTGSFYSYQWYKNGVAIAGANSSTLIETGNGDYTVVVTDINGCSDTSATYVLTIGGGGGGTGVTNVNTSSSIKVFPNPATSTLTIEASQKVNVSLLAVDGKMVLHQDNAHNIDISELPNGMYLIMIYDENNLLLSTSKFVKTEQ